MMLGWLLHFSSVIHHPPYPFHRPFIIFSGNLLHSELENGTKSLLYPLKVVIFHRFFVCLPEGNWENPWEFDGAKQ